MEDIYIVSHANDNTHYVSVNNKDEVIDFWEQAANTLFKWFKDTHREKAP